MAITLHQTYVDTYDAMVTTLAQQERSLLLPHVMVRSERSKNHRFTTVGAVSMTSSDKSSGRFADRTATTFTDTPWAGRLVGVKLGRIADSIEIHDEPQMNGLISAGSHIVRAHSMAAARQIDDWIIAAAIGNATPASGSAAGLPSANKTTVDISGSAELDSEFWAGILQKFASDNATGPKVLVVPPEIIKHMYGIDEYKNNDYTVNNLNALMGDGILASWMGFTWIVSTRLANTNSNKNKEAFAFQPGSIGFKMNKRMESMIQLRPDLWNLHQFSCQMMGDAVRIEDNRVHHVSIKYAS